MTESTAPPPADIAAGPLDPERELAWKLETCEARLGYVFQDKRLLQAALTHASGADHRLASNERLEFLGDAILGAVVCEMLYQGYPEYLEGDLTKIKSVVVSRKSCARISQRLGLQQLLFLGKGMATYREVPPSLLSDVFESLLAALYLDGGAPVARAFIETHVGPEIESAVAGATGGNYKSLLQQLAQRKFGNTPVYHLIGERGPDHAKSFQMSASVGGQRYQAAWGRNKKEAEQRAARNALAQIHEEPPPYPSD